MTPANDPTPAIEESEDLSTLREQLKAQRARRKEGLAKLKATTFQTLETVRKGTTFLDRDELERRLGEEEEEADTAED